MGLQAVKHDGEAIFKLAFDVQNLFLFIDEVSLFALFYLILYMSD